MQDNAKCFIRLKKGIYEEITYKELKEKRKKYSTYKKKKFIKIDDVLLEVLKKDCGANLIADKRAVFIYEFCVDEETKKMILEKIATKMFE